jgi:chemotaxis protein CheD
MSVRSSPLAEFQDYTFHHIHPGDFKVVSCDDEVVSTLLGSCIAACMRCSITGIGGVNHFLLPSVKGGGQNADDDKVMRYGDYAMNALVGAIIRAGGHRDSLEVKIFGGANMYDTESRSPVGRSNIQFVLNYVHAEGITLLAEDIGGTRGRKIYFHPATGKVKVQRMQGQKAADVKAFETNYGHKLDQESDTGTIELFG